MSNHEDEDAFDVPELAPESGPEPAHAPAPESAPESALDPELTGTEITAPTPTEKKVKKIIRKKVRRPARPQVDPSFITSEPPPQTGTVFNIWYNKWSGGDREDKYLSQTQAKGRCNVAQDAGFTAADSIPGSFFCLFFARGLCPKGRDCQYLHRLPTIHDLYNPNIDCFGRDKYSDYRDDMGGVGSFMRTNRTVYVGRIHVADDIEEVVARHFAEWGQVERIRVLNSKGVAFITYSNEANAQFAKEAMAHQSLDHEEILNVRWATADPNPMAKAREQRRVEEQAAEAVRRALPAEFIAEIEGRSRDAGKRRRIAEGSGGMERRHDAPYTMGHAEEAGAADSGWREPSGIEAADSGQTPEEAGGIFSSRTLAALNSAKAQVVSRANATVAAGPLVAYGSDDESD